jgi:hypothetical protein
LKRLDPIAFVLFLAAAWLAFGGVSIEGCRLPTIGGGADLFVVLHDGAKDDAATAELIQEFQDSDSPVAKEIAAAGWQALALDDDTTSPGPKELLTKLGVHGSIADNRRELLAIAKPDKLVSREPIPPGTTADQLLAMMRARGKR